MMTNLDPLKVIRCTQFKPSQARKIMAYVNQRIFKAKNEKLPYS